MISSQNFASPIKTIKGVEFTLSHKGVNLILCDRTEFFIHDSGNTLNTFLSVAAILAQAQAFPKWAEFRNQPISYVILRLQDSQFPIKYTKTVYREDLPPWYALFLPPEANPDLLLGETEEHYTRRLDALKRTTYNLNKQKQEQDQRRKMSMSIIDLLKSE